MPTTARSPSSRTHSWSLVKRTVLIRQFPFAGSTGVIAVRHKRQAYDPRRAGGAAHKQGERGAFRGMAAIDITHRDGAADRRAEAAARHSPNRHPGGVDDRGILACRRASVRPDADADARRPFSELAQYDFGAGKPALGTPPLADGPGEGDLDRARRLVDVVPIEAEPGLEAQRVAGALPDRPNFGPRDQRLGDRRSCGRRYRDLEPVLTGV